MESIKKYIIVPVNGINQKVKYLSLFMESNKKLIFIPVNGINQKVNICVR